MVFKKEFWVAIFCFVLTAVVAIQWIREGFESYRATGTVLFPLVGIAFLRKAIKES